MRAKSAAIPLPGFMSGNAKSTTTASSLKRRRIAQPTQRMWTYLTNDVASTSTSVAPSHDKGKPKGKGKGKSKGKSLKGKSWSPGKGIPKGKGKYNSWNPKGKGMTKGSKGTRSFPQKRPHPVMHGANSSGTSDNSHDKGTSSSTTSAAPTVRCHFCNKLGHYKNNCRQYQSLRNSPACQARLSHPARTQLIYDHLEDSVFAPKTCPTTSCTNMSCDGYNCSYTPFPEDEFLSAESYFNDNLLSSVENAKLDRPMDSTPPLARSVYVAQEAYWGEPWGHDQAYQTDGWYGEDWHDHDEEHPGYSMDYE
jgi:hypothetical protein